jgi:hypothetical protein
MSMVSSYSAAFASHTAASSQPVHQRLVTWSCPGEGTVCLNVDGSMMGSTQDAGFRGFFRNNFGSFLKGFYGKAVPPQVFFLLISWQFFMALKFVG